LAAKRFWFIMRLAAKAPRRRRPVSSTLGRRSTPTALQHFTMIEQPDEICPYEALIEPAFESVNICAEPDEFVRQFSSLRPTVGHVFAAHWCQGEVCNGGFHQFFFNSAGVLAPEALRAFKELGLVEWADLLDAAMRLLGTPYPRQLQARHAVLPMPSRRGQKRGEWDPFTELDNRFYAWLTPDSFRWEKVANAYAEAAA
jgi:hypothetical protein